ncbi:Na+/H+ antiporter subunit E [Pontibacter chinhatensis]|uniref:Multicomponent Na+:H+ antiporter subunit E n=1 Tax=Pontibacter chinhatensis TaxID=1436961 RepID=A0A1I2MJ87_9BACT|nr:Na+/H+ antiporter subunit E [Pontibacter chinhatensis]SFF89617.1 multicomponent Na+:H+ antiporter subunit E [Pontibacter chinhatensis]
MRLLLIHAIMAAFLTYFAFQHAITGGMPYTAISATLLFAAVMFILWLSTYFYRRTYFHKLPKLLYFILFFIKELLVANLKIAYDIITPHFRIQPTVMAYPLTAKTDLEISLLANLLGLTPGTLSIDVSEDRSTLFVHTLYLKHGDVQHLKQHIKNGYERRILELTA